MTSRYDSACGLIDQRKLEQDAIERERKESELIRETQRQVTMEEVSVC